MPGRREAARTGGEPGDRSAPRRERIVQGADIREGVRRGLGGGEGHADRERPRIGDAAGAGGKPVRRLVDRRGHLALVLDDVDVFGLERDPLEGHVPAPGHAADRHRQCGHGRNRLAVGDRRRRRETARRVVGVCRDQSRTRSAISEIPRHRIRRYAARRVQAKLEYRRRRQTRSGRGRHDRPGHQQRRRRRGGGARGLGDGDGPLRLKGGSRTGDEPSREQECDRQQIAHRHCDLRRLPKRLCRCPPTE